MSDERPTPEELAAIIARQARESAESRARVAQLEAALEETRRAGTRQAAPVAERPPKPDPKPPGREPGHAPRHRATPAPEAVDRTVDVPLPADCPACGMPLATASVVIHDPSQIDRPEPRPVTSRSRVPGAECPACGARVPGRHPEPIADALGAAAVPFGPRLLGLAADLKPRLGVSDRMIASLLTTLTGLIVTAGALARSGHRLRRGGQASFDHLVQAARTAAGPDGDETGWRIGGRSAWLGVFADARMTPSRIRRSRGHDVVVEALGDDFAAVIVSDGFLAYDPLAGPKQKGLGHLLRTGHEIEEIKTRGAVRFSRPLAALLRRAMALRRRRDRLTPSGYQRACRRVHRAWDRLLAGHSTDPDNARRAGRLRKHRAALLTSLDREDVEPTSNLAERELRPAVIARKLSAGDRTEAGAETHAVLASLLQTGRRRGRDILQVLGDWLRHGPGHVVDLLDNLSPAPIR